MNVNQKLSFQGQGLRYMVMEIAAVIKGHNFVSSTSVKGNKEISRDPLEMPNPIS